MKIRRIFLAVVVVALALLACQTPALVSQESPQEGSQSVNVSTVPTLMPVNLESSNPIAQQEVLVQLYQTVSPGTVAIITDVGQGSGFVYDTNGHVVTNYHVIEGAQSVEVRFTSGYRVYGTVIGTDLDSDLAVIEVDAPAEELHSLPLGDSAALNVGQTVVAIGNPFGLESTMTVGIISALGRTLDSAHTSPDGNFFTAGDIIQTDAAINPGNSGGPLFNLNGEVIGINRAIRTTNYTDTGEPVNSGIGFAISINIVKRVVPVLIKSGEYNYPYLGVSSISTLSLDAINELGLKQYTGAYVTTVVPGGPADKAGIKAGDKQTNFPNLFSGGDLIIAIDGREVRTFDDLLAYLITNKGPGDTVVLTILRGDEKMDVSIKLDKRP